MFASYPFGLYLSPTMQKHVLLMQNSHNILVSPVCEYAADLNYKWRFYKPDPKENDENLSSVVRCFGTCMFYFLLISIKRLLYFQYCQIQIYSRMLPFKTMDEVQHCACRYLQVQHQLSSEHVLLFSNLQTQCNLYFRQYLKCSTEVMWNRDAQLFLKC